jgi:predicted dienelactone hydrolase
MFKTTLSLAFIVFFGGLAYCQYQVGHTTITFNDPSRTGGFGSGGGTGRQIQTEIYYPATTAGENVTASAGTFPVIVFGHGFAMSWDAYTNIWEHYVAMGYIMAFPRTEGSLVPSPSHADFGLDLSLVEQRVQAENVLSSSVLYQHVGANSAIMGHSMGGGATILAAQNNTNIKTIVGLAPAETTPSAITASSSASVPSVIYSGSSDGVTPPADHHEPIYDGLTSGCKTFVSIIGGAHCYFANSNAACDFGELTSSTGISISREQQQATTFASLDLWFDYILKGNASSLDAFLNELSSTPAAEVESQTTCVSTASINEWTSSLEVLYPNPVAHELILPVDLLTKYQLMDAQGKLLSRAVFNGVVDVQHLEKGVYFIHTDQRNYTFIKE